MGNTINKSVLLTARVLTLLQEPTAWEMMANREYEWELKAQGDTVRVQTFPKIEWNSQTWVVAETKGWESISVTDWELGKEDLKIDRLSTINIKIKDIEKAISNLNLETGLLKSISDGKKRNVSKFIQKTAINGAWLEVWDAANKKQVTDDNVLKVIWTVKAKLDQENVPHENRYLYIKPDLEVLIVSAKWFNGTAFWADMLVKWFIGTLLWFNIVKDTTLPDWIAIACDKNSVHYVSKYDKVKVVDGSTNNEGFWDNILGELIDWCKVFDVNKKRICKLHYEVA